MYIKSNIVKKATLAKNGQKNIILSFDRLAFFSDDEEDDFNMDLQVIS